MLFQEEFSVKGGPLIEHVLERHSTLQGRHDLS
jgi:hypothetical protein